MHPVLFHVASHPVPTHDFFVGLGLIVATVFFGFEARRTHRLNLDTMTIAAGGLLGAAIGARLGNLVRYWIETPDATVARMLIDSGKTVVGGLAGAYVAVVLTKRVLGYREDTGDMFAAGVALGIAVGRIGCLLTEPVRHGPSAGSTDISFVYEIAFMAALCVVLLALRSRLAPWPGDLFKIFLAAYVVFRFFIEFVRGNDVLAFGLTRPQLFLLVTAPLLGVHFYRRFRDGGYRRPIVPTVALALEGAHS